MSLNDPFGLGGLAHPGKGPGIAAKPPASAAVLAADYVIYERDGDRSVNAWRTDDAPLPTGGYGGWQTHTRPKKRSLVVWEGREPFQIPVPLLLYRNGQPINSLIRDLDAMGSGTDDTPPPVVRIKGALMIPANAGADWVIQDIAWSEEIRHLLIGRDYHVAQIVTRILATVTLYEHVTDRHLAASTLTDRRGRGTVIKHYKVKKGDTLVSIAAHKLGDPKRWVDIAALNGLRSSGKLKPNQTLRLP